MKLRILNFLSRIVPFGWLRLFLPQKFILYGHVISDHEHFVRNAYQYPNFNEFDDLVNLLNKAGYEFVDFKTYLENDKRKKVLLSIDDGFRVVKYEMHEKLKTRRIPYVLFVTTRPLEEPDYVFPSLQRNLDRREWPSEPLFLNQGEINFLKADGVDIGFHTKSHCLIEEDTDLSGNSEIVIEQNFQNLFSEPLLFSYPYLAPANYRNINQHIQHATGARYFFDTKGFIAPDANHFFRVCIDSPLDLSTSNNAVFMIKRQILQSLYQFNKQKKSL